MSHSVETKARETLLTMPASQPVPGRNGRGPMTETKVSVKDVSVYYRSFQRHRRRHARYPGQLHHGHHRAVRLR